MYKKFHISNTLDYSIRSELFFYLYFSIIPFLYIIQTLQGISLFPIFYIISLFFWYKILKLNFKINNSIYLIIILFSIGILISYYHRGNVVFEDLLKFISTFGIALFCIYYRFKYLKNALIIISILHTSLFFLTSDNYINETGISYHSTGFSIITLWILYVLKERPKDILLAFLLLTLILILRGRTHIFIGIFLFLTIFYENYKHIEPIRIFLISLFTLLILLIISVVFLSGVYTYEQIVSLKFLEDIVTRGFSSSIRQGFWGCYFEHISLYSFIAGNISGYDNCVLETWALSFPDTVDRDVNADYIQYENSFFRLNHKIGGFIGLYYLMIIYSFFKLLMLRQFFVILIASLFFIRMSTADLFFFLPYDFFFYFIIIYIFYFNIKIKDKN